MANLVALLRLLGTEATVSGAVITARGAAIEVVADCTPVLPLMTLWAAILAFPARLGPKAVGALASAGVLWIYNLVRVAALLYLLGANPALFDPIHAYLWQPVTIAFVLGLFILWVRLEQGARRGAA